MKTSTWNQSNIHFANHDNTQEVVVLHANKDFVQRCITIEKNSTVYIVEIFNTQEENTFHTQFVVKENASLHYIKLQQSKQTVHTHFTFELDKSSWMIQHNFELGLANSNHTYKALLKSPDSKLVINGLVKLFSNASCESHFDIQHHNKNTLSQIEYKHALHDESKALFQANSIVQNNAPFSQAYQNCNTLLLSDNATIFAQPHLEIQIDELQASHGATTGGLNKDELLYLQSRGIDEQSAHNILLKAFENEMYDKITHTKIKEYIKEYKRSDHE